MKNTKLKEQIPVFFATDDGYAPFLGVALASILENLSPRCELAVYILTVGLNEKNESRLRRLTAGRASLKFVDVSREMEKLDGRICLRDYYSQATYYRFFISKLFPQYDKALYLDGDIIVTGDLAELYHTRLGRKLVAAVQEEVMAKTPVFGRYAETVPGVPCPEYFNAGVLVMNLAEFRRQRVDEQFFRLLSERKFPVTQDQDYLNVICRDKSVILGYEWNKTPYAEDSDFDPKLTHFKLQWKPWHYDNVTYSERFWAYAEKTEFYEDICAMRDSYTDADRARDALAHRRLCLLAEQETAAEEARRAMAGVTVRSRA